MDAPERIGNYVVFPAFASGASASVHLARLVRPDGFRRLLVLKRFRRALFSDRKVVDRFLREARLSSRVRSPYIVATLDIVPSELAIVMEFVHGVTLARLMKCLRETNTRLEPAVCVAIVGNVLRGLDAAHEATADDGTRLDLVHRDVAPQNVIVGSDGLARLLDFGVATALGERLTASGEVCGTLGYIAPEQIRDEPVTRRVDLFATGVILWELLTGARFRPEERAHAIANLDAPPTCPSAINPDVPAALDGIVTRAVAFEPAARYGSAFAMAAELDAAVRPATPHEVGRLIERLVFDELDRLRELVLAAEQIDTAETNTDPTARQPAGGSPRFDAEYVPNIGAVIAGRYRVDSVIGRGGMGVVAAARHLTLNQTVALKFLTRKTEPAATERILREARTAMRLNGEHVVRVFDAGIEDGVPYIVMEKLDGTDLKAVLRDEGALPVADVVRLGLQLCEVLAEAHAIGIVHRDLKPANLFLTNEGTEPRRLKVLDFGIAKVSGDLESDEDHPSLTETGVLLGSPAYMSPEQLRSAKNVDARTDIWAMGVVLFELLTNRHPFASMQRTETLARVMADEPTAIRKLRPEIPEGVARAIHACLRKNPDKRMPSAVGMAQALAPFAPGVASPSRIRRISAQSGVPVSSRQFEHGWRWQRVALAAAVPIALVAASGLLRRTVPTAAQNEPVSDGASAHREESTRSTAIDIVSSERPPSRAAEPAVASGPIVSAPKASGGRAQNARPPAVETTRAAPGASSALVTPERIPAPASAGPTRGPNPVRADAGEIESDPSAAFR